MNAEDSGHKDMHLIRLNLGTVIEQILVDIVNKLGFH
jgi:hypothetical protein